MQPGVTVVLATVWLYASAVGTASLDSSRFSLDQYSPLAPRRELYRRLGGQLDWKDQSPVENQPFDLSISPRRSSSATFPWHPDGDPSTSRGKTSLVADDFSPLVEDNRRRKDLTGRRVDGGGAKAAEDPFVADDTFQDQGPGSMEIYKLDLLGEKSLLITRHPSKGKGKTPKKTSQADWKTKPMEHKSIGPKLFHKQSNTFDDLSTEVPPNGDLFGIGGVPELQVGCEGLEAWDQKRKRSVDPREAMDAWAGVTPVPLDLDYDFSVEEEEMDELVRLKKLETTTRGVKNRGDMEATGLDFDEKRRSERLPVRGDLGKTDARNSSDDRRTFDDDKTKREVFEVADGSLTARRRRILWMEDPLTDELAVEVRRKRQMWGFGEDEGVVSSDELQTENQRRRQDYDRRRQEWERRRSEEAHRRSYVENRTNSEVERIRQEYERDVQERTRQEEERQRRLEEARRREQRQRQESHHHPPRRYESTYEEERRRHQEVEARRRQQEVDRRNLEQRRREWMLKRRQEEEEEKRRQNEPSNIAYAMRAAPGSWSYLADKRRQEETREEMLKEYVQRNRPVDRRREEEERRRQEEERRRQEEERRRQEEERRRQEEERRRQEEERRRQEEERKLQEYVRRNQPVHVANESSMNERYGSGVYNWSRYPGQSGRRDHGPSAPTNIDPRGYAEAERIRERERLEQERLRKEALRREEEMRRAQSRRYEEQRKRLEALEWERRRQESTEEQARRSQSGRTRSENARTDYDEHRRRQDASLIPANLVLNESRREQERQELERRRLEGERRRTEDARAKEAREREQRARLVKEQRRRQEEARLNALPVSARIIVRPAHFSPGLSSRTGIDEDIDFPGVNPYRRGVEVANFPTAPTRRPPVQSPPACVWAVVQCCPFNTNRLVTCFESMGCPGVNWDPNPCRGSITKSAREQIAKFYADSEEDNRGL